MTKPIISSLQNQRVKQAIKLRDRRHRERQGRILIDGVRELSRALAGGVQPLEVFACPPRCRTVEAQNLLAEVQGSAADVWQVTPDVFARLAFGKRAEGLVAVASTPTRGLDSISLGTNPLVAILDGVEKPGNLGAVLRSADAAGLSAVVATGEGTDLYNPNCIRASLGTVFTMQVCAAEAEEALEWVERHQLKLYAARPDAGVLYTEASFAGPAALLLGSEATGLSERWPDEALHPIKIPMLGTADSLNVSAAAAVLFYEALRQRTPVSTRSTP